MTVTCTECEGEIKFYEDDFTVTIIYKSGRMEERCHHHPFNEHDPEIVAILGSKDCYQRYIARQASLN